MKIIKIQTVKWKDFDNMTNKQIVMECFNNCERKKRNTVVMLTTMSYLVCKSHLERLSYRQSIGN